MLGDLGIGKTTLTLNYLEVMWIKFIKNPSKNSIPVYIALNKEMVNDSFEIIVQKHFQKQGILFELVHLYYFMLLFYKGFFTIILDGFDFLADGLDFERQKICFQKFLPKEDCRGKVILTCRTHYFRSINEQKDTIISGETTDFYSEAIIAPCTQIIYLQEFSEDQVAEYVKKCGHEEDLKRIKEIYNFYEMSKRPLLLKLIINSMNELEKNQDPTIIVSLYKHYINAWLKRDELPDNRSIMDKATKKSLMIELAWKMWDSGTFHIHHESLMNFLQKKHSDKHLKESELEKILRNTMRASFLNRDTEGNFSFMHQSFMEYFVALNIYEAASSNSAQLPKILKTKRFNPAINHFLAMFDYETNILITSLHNILEQTYQEKISENALNILYSKARFNCGMHKEFDTAQSEKMIQSTKDIFPKKLRLSGANLNAMNLRGAWLEKANLSQSDLSHTKLSYSILTRARFIGCNLTKADFTYAKASEAVFKEANVTETNFSFCQLHSSDFRGALHTDSANFSNAEGVSDSLISQKLIIPVVQKGGHCRKVEISTISHDDILCASGGNDGLIFVYNKGDLRIRWVFEGHTGSIVCLQFSKDHKRLISGSSDKSVRLWNIEKGKLAHVFSGHTQAVTSVCFSPNEQIIASGSYDKSVRLWNANTYDLIACLTDAKTFIQSIYFPESNDIISAIDIDQREYQWLIETNQLIAEESNSASPAINKTDSRLDNLTGHQSGINCVSFSTDGHFLVCASMDQTVRIWNLKKAKVEQVIQEHKGEVSSICVAPNENWFASASYDKTIKIWDLSTGKHKLTLTGHSARVYDISISKVQNRSILASAGNNDRIFLWDSSTGEKIGELIAPDRCRIITVDFSPDATIIAASGNTGNIYLWDLVTRKHIHTLESHHSGIEAISFSNDAKWLASASQDKTVRLWNMDNHDINFLFTGHEDEVLTVCFANTQPLLASGSRDNTVRIYNFETRKCIAVLENHMGRVLSVCFAPHDKYLIAAGEAGRLQFWDYRKNQVILYRYFFEEDAWLNLLPDGRFDGNDNGIRYLSYTEQDTLISKRASELKNENFKPDEVLDAFARYL
jgi:WD40 repeat protein